MTKKNNANNNANKERLLRINKFFKEGNFQGVVGEIRHWLEDIRTGEMVFDLENLRVVYKRDSQQAINTAITAKVEEKAKEIICPKIPNWISPDHLTLIGIIGIVMTSVGFVLGYLSRYYLILVPLGLIINWFGGSFDGSIARYRKRTRPNYGYYIDKMVDAIVMIILGLGLGLSGFVKIEIAILFIAIYLVMMINVDLLVYVKGETKNSFGLLGPTEARIIGIIISVVMFFVPVKSYDIYGYLVTQYDIVVLALSVLMFFILMFEIFKNGVRLNKEDTKDW